MALDSHSVAFLEGLAKNGVKPFHQMEVAEARLFMAGLRSMIGPGPDMFDVREALLPCATGTFQVRTLKPLQDPRGIIVYCHGGGWALMSIDDYDTLGRRLASETGCTVVLVDYRLAPEYPFPAALDDVWKAMTWADANRLTLGHSKRAPLLIAGDSAGGNLAAVTAQSARGLVDIAQQVLIYPVTSNNIDAACYSAAENQGLLGRADMQWFWDFYLPDVESRNRPEASPLHQKDLHGLAPVVVVTAAHDILREEGQAYVGALRGAGVQVDHRCFEGQMHGFFSMDHLLPASHNARDYVANSIRERLGHLHRTPA